MRIIACVLLLLLLGSAHAQQTLIEKLQEGGYVIYWRHASANVCSDCLSLGKAEVTTHPSWWSSCAADCPVADCTSQVGRAVARQLNDEGRQESLEIGAEMRARGIQFDKVLTSEFCRNFRTAELMNMGPVVLSEELTYWVYDEDQRCANTFALLNTPPPAGMNTALIGHSGNSCPTIAGLGWAHAAVYKPNPGGDPELVQIVLPNEWKSLPPSRSATCQELRDLYKAIPDDGVVDIQDLSRLLVNWGQCLGLASK